MYYMLCCDIATLRCSSAELERKIAEFSTRYHKLSDNLWLYCTPKDKTMQYFVAPEKYLVLYALQEYMTPESCVFSFAIPKNGYCYQLSDAAREFRKASHTSSNLRTAWVLQPPMPFCFVSNRPIAVSISSANMQSPTAFTVISHPLGLDIFSPPSFTRLQEKSVRS